MMPRLNAKKDGVPSISGLLTKCKTGLLFLITCNEDQHLLETKEYVSLSKALGLTFEEYVSSTITGGFLEPAPDGSNDRLQQIPDAPFISAFSPSCKKKHEVQQFAFVLDDSKLYHFLYRGKKKPTLLPRFAPPKLCVAVEAEDTAGIEMYPVLVSPTDDGSALNPCITVESDADYPGNVVSPTTSLLPTEVVTDFTVDEGFEVRLDDGIPTPTHEASTGSTGFSAGASGPRVSNYMYPQTDSADDPVARAWVCHGLDLDFQRRDENGKRPSRIFRYRDEVFQMSGTNGIKIMPRKNATQTMKLIAISMALNLCNYRNARYKQKEKIAKAVVSIVCYDKGFEVPRGFSKNVFNLWLKEWEEGVAQDTSNIFSGDHLGPRTGRYYERIDQDFPLYIVELFRDAVKVTTAEAPNREIAAMMNTLSIERNKQSLAALEAFEEAGGGGVQPIVYPVLTLNRDSLRRWFASRGGKEKKSHDKPILDPQRMTKRVAWCKDKLNHIYEDEDGYYVCWLDEKWFYTQSRRKKTKILPLQEGEPEGADNLPQRRSASRRFATKVMFLGVIARHGKVYLTRVAEEQVSKQQTINTDFSDDTRVNFEIVQEWRPFLEEEFDNDFHDTEPDDLLEALVERFEFRDDVEDRLCFWYWTYNGKKKNRVVWSPSKSFSDLRIRDEGSRQTRAVTIKDLELGAIQRRGTVKVKDTTCDSKFMLEHMDEIGQAIRDSFAKSKHELKCVDDKYPDPIFLIMDNAGGHGTKDAIIDYTEHLKEKYNIILVHQIPRSPETNLLDLGTWMSIQSAVEKWHRFGRTNVDALARTVEEVWNKHWDDSVVEAVYQRWKRVLRLIVEDDGDNKRTDACRGELFKAFDLPLPNADLPLDAFDLDDSDDEVDSLC